MWPELIPEDEKSFIKDTFLALQSKFGCKPNEVTFLNIEKTFESIPELLEQADFDSLIEIYSGLWRLSKDKVFVTLFPISDFDEIDFLSKPNLIDEIAEVFLFRHFIDEDYQYEIVVSKRNAQYKNVILYIICSFFSTIKLIENDYLDLNHGVDFFPVDLTSLYFGFGSLIINNSPKETIEYEGEKTNGTSYLQALIYAAAFLCRINKDTKLNGELFNSPLDILVITAYDYLKDISPISIEAMDKAKELDVLFEKRLAAYKNNDFQKGLEIIESINEMDYEFEFILADKGYLNLQLKNYSESISYFDQALQHDRGYHYSNYNNRGYAKLQLGKNEEAYSDFLASNQLNPSNPFLIRNIGAYHFKIQNYPTALKFFNDAKALKPDLDLIYFYLSICSQKMGRIEDAQKYATISLQRNEHNDSSEPDLEK